MDKDIRILPVTAIIPTANRRKVLTQTLESFAMQNFQPVEIIIVDASENANTVFYEDSKIPELKSKLIIYTANQKGAAIQRSEGLKYATSPFILFADDDIILEEGCIEMLWKCLASNELAGASNALVTNQHYCVPGRLTNIMYRLMHGEKLDSYAGKCIGPAWNLLPAGNSPIIYNEVEWINTTCSLYKRDALPDPLFPMQFTGYSLMEDLAMSLIVSRKWKLFNVSTAKIFHNSQPGIHKNSTYRVSKMELVNRYYIMKNILKRRGFVYCSKLVVFELWGIFTSLATAKGRSQFFPNIFGKAAGIFSLIKI